MCQQPTTINGLEFYNACWCAGTGCGGHLPVRQAFINFTPILPAPAAIPAAAHSILGLPAVT